MKKLINDFKNYVNKVAGMRAAWGPPVPKPMPQYLTVQYVRHKVIVDGQAFLGILLKDNAGFRPAVFEKHLRKLIDEDIGLKDYCLVARGLPGYTRRRLVERQIPFVIPGQQMFWPALGLAAQARKTGKSPIPVEILSPAAQGVVIYALNGKIGVPVTPKTLAEKLGYAHMTMSRALDEIEANELGRVIRQGRERLLDFPDERRVVWQAALPYLRSPVGAIKRIKEKELPLKGVLRAGQTALADVSMLTAPGEPVYAMSRKAWKITAKTVETIPVEDDGTCSIEIWRYDPVLFAGKNLVDPFSLYLSLQDDRDERIESAMAEMMEQLL